MDLLSNQTASPVQQNSFNLNRNQNFLKNSKAKRAKSPMLAYDRRVVDDFKSVSIDKSNKINNQQSTLNLSQLKKLIKDSRDILDLSSLGLVDLDIEILR